MCLGFVGLLSIKGRKWPRRVERGRVWKLFSRLYIYMCFIIPGKCLRTLPQFSGGFGLFVFVLEDATI